MTMELTLTVMFWINMSDDRLTREFLCGNDPFYSLSIILEKSTSNQISFYCGDGERINNKHAKYSAYTGRLPYNKYSHICFMRNNTDIYVYINGKLNQRYPIRNIVLKNNTFTIGKSNYWYLSDLTQDVKFFKLYNTPIDINKLNKLVNYNNYAYYYEDNFSNRSNHSK